MNPRLSVGCLVQMLALRLMQRVVWGGQFKRIRRSKGKCSQTFTAQRKLEYKQGLAQYVRCPGEYRIRGIWRERNREWPRSP